MTTRAAQAGFALVAMLGFGGCGFLHAPVGDSSGLGKGVKRVRVTTPYAVTETVQPGTVLTPVGPGIFGVNNQRVKGTFSVTLPFKVDPFPKKKKAAAAGGGFRSLSGTFISKLDGTYNALTGEGTFTGFKVLRFNHGKLGDACLVWNSNVSNGGTSETGSFRLEGGTKLAARSRGTGTFTGTKSQIGTTATVTGTITTGILIGKNPKPPAIDCQGLAALL